MSIQKKTSVNEIWQKILSRDLILDYDIRNNLYPDRGKDPFYILTMIFAPLEGGVTERQQRWIGELFPDAIHIPDEREIVILEARETQIFGRDLPPEVEKRAAQENGIICVGNATRHCSALRTNYMQISRMKQLVLLYRKRNEFVFYLEDYQTRMIIDNCVKEFVRQNDMENVLYLVHPAVVHVGRFDEANGTDLREVLYQYLRFGGSVQKTADAVYMHRNTVMKKIKQINDIVPIDLKDGLLCHRLLMSCQLLEYCEVVLNMRINWGSRGENNRVMERRE